MAHCSAVQTILDHNPVPPYVHVLFVLSCIQRTSHPSIIPSNFNLYHIKTFLMFCGLFWTLAIVHDICATLGQYQTMTEAYLAEFSMWMPWHSFMTGPRCQAAHSAQPEGSTSSVGIMDVIHQPSPAKRREI